ncbi:MAG: glutathione peroxidase [Bacteroidia bacterium]|nr:glutathione peroxidase [Bacteroidia bacterium]
MKITVLLFVLIFLIHHNAMAQKTIHEFEIKTLDGKVLKFSDFKGKKILLVNVASYCGYTPQYADLEKLHKQYSDKLVVVGVPCNQFGGQEPGSHEEIKNFCTKNYGVTFALTEKVNVKGEKVHPIYAWLSDKNKNGVLSEVPGWNFCKFLFDEKGIPMAFFKSGVNPMSEEITRHIK